MELERLRGGFIQLRDIGLNLNPQKLHLLKKSVMFLGHVVSDKGLSTDPEKLKEVCEWPTPTSASVVRSLLGLCSYNCRFIFGLVIITAPLHRLTEKDKAFASCPKPLYLLNSLL